jgi:hypothetical protein
MRSCYNLECLYREVKKNKKIRVLILLYLSVLCRATKFLTFQHNFSNSFTFRISNRLKVANVLIIIIKKFNSLF